MWILRPHEPYKANSGSGVIQRLPAAGVVMESVVATILAIVGSGEVLDNLEELENDAVARHREFVKNF